jgi:hypothetical protein
MRPNVNLPPQGTPSGTAAGFGYAILCYAAFQATFVYFILFLNGVLVPKGIDDGAVRALPVALALNLGLIVLWGLQHWLAKASKSAGRVSSRLTRSEPPFVWPRAWPSWS